jgi:hypothetical protein
MHAKLTETLDRLSGCQGTWILDLRDRDQRGHDLHYLSSGCPLAGWGTVKDPADALRYCIAQHWRQCRLLFSADRLNADCSWPGGYEAPSIYRSNNRVFADEFSAQLELADGDADGLALDIRYVTTEMLDTIDALEDYPLLSEDDHSELEVELQGEAWGDWVERDWSGHVEAALRDRAPADCEDPDQWAEDQLELISAERLFQLFRDCCESTSTYWQEESGDQWIDLERAAEALPAML